MRLDGWDVRLAEAVEAARSTPFRWGAHDCATWAFDVRMLLTGSDAAAAWRGRYRTSAGARRVMTRLGWVDLRTMAVALLGAPLDTPLLAQRGDIVLGGDPVSFGVVLGAEVAFLQPVGLLLLPVDAVSTAWRV